MLLNRFLSLMWIDMPLSDIPVDESKLKKIAVEVGKLLVDDFALGRFREQIREYVRLEDEANKQDRTVEKKMNEHVRKALSDPRFLDEEAGPPEPGWQWLNHPPPNPNVDAAQEGGELPLYDPDPDAKQVCCWTPPSECPVHPIPLPGQTLESAAALLPGHYARLAVIHDRFLTEAAGFFNPGEAPILCESEGWAAPQLCLLRDYECNLAKVHGFHPDNIEKALQAVRKDLERVGAGTVTQPNAPNENGDSEADAVGVRESTSEECSHSDDFTSCIWFGARYEFTRLQAACVKALWEARERGHGTLNQETIQKKSGSSAAYFRLDKTFRDHPAFGVMIQKASKGIYKLAPPTENPTQG